MRLVCDSSSDIYAREDVEYRYVPLSIACGGKLYIDTPETDPAAMLRELKNSKEKSSSSCPNVNQWLEAFRGADEIFCVTITGGLSGTYSSALQAKDMYLEENPKAKLHVFDSRGTGPSLVLLADRIAENITEGKSFEEIVEDVTAYSQKIKLVFSLHSLDNLARNGRVNPLVAKGVGIFNIRIIGEASPEGTLTPLKQCRNRKKEVELLIAQMNRQGYHSGKIVLHHANNPEIEAIVAQIQEAFPKAAMQIRAEGCLDTYYTEEEGILIGYEHE